MKGLFYLVVTMVVIIACTNEEFDANSKENPQYFRLPVSGLYP